MRVQESTGTVSIKSQSSSSKTAVKSQRRPVWMLISTFYPGIGGAERQAQWLSKRLMAAGWPVRVLTRRHTHYPNMKRLPARDTVDGIPLRRLYSRGPVKIGMFFYALMCLWRLIRGGRGGIYHAHDVGLIGWTALAARYLLGGRCVVKLRSGYPHYRKRLSSRFTRWHILTLLRLADRVIVVNGDVERLFTQLGVPSERMVRVSNSVDIWEFHPATPGEKLAARLRLGLLPEKTVLLYVGRLEYVKGVDVLLKAWSLMPARLRQETQLVLVGGGSEKTNLQSMIKSLELDDSVIMAGPQPVVREYYWAADLFVLPSRSEGLSSALVEAMACGLPVVASGVGGARELVRAGENGFLFPLEDSEQLARILGARCWGPRARDSLAPAMGACARETVLERADLSATAGRVSELYSELWRGTGD